MAWWVAWPSANWVTLLLGFGVIFLVVYVARRAFDAADRDREVSWRYCASCQRYHVHVTFADALPCDEQRGQR